MMLQNKIRQSRSDVVFDIFNYSLVTFFFLTVFYPLFFVVIASVSNPDLVNLGKVWLLPKELNFLGYQKVFQDHNIWLGYRNTIIYTSLGTTINVILTLPAGYVLSRKDLVGRMLFMRLLIFTMLFHGGLIPTYLIVKSLGILNTIWVMVIPSAVAVWNVVIARAFFEGTIPFELLEASRVDGCSNQRFFWSIVLPISSALIAVETLFYAIQHWNAFFQALIYLNDQRLYPLQLFLRDILLRQELSEELTEDVRDLIEMQRLSEIIKYALIIVASLPVLVLYPFLQHYFVKGVMIGAIKG